MGFLQKGEEWLRLQRAKNTRAIVYRRGVDSQPMQAVQAETRAKTSNGEIVTNSHFIDWLIERADLELDGDLVEPFPGDQIDVTYSHGVESFAVVMLGAEPCWRWHGRDGQTFRIHTVRV